MSDNEDRILTPGEVAYEFKVDPKTVTRWAAAGKIPHFLTPGGHHRFYRSDIKAMIEATKRGRP